MAKRAAVAKAIAEISGALPHLIRLPKGRAWIDYDEEADVLYVSLQRPQKATETEFLEKRGILLRYRNKELVGLTVLDASKRREAGKKRSTNVSGLGSVKSPDTVQEGAQRYGQKSKRPKSR